MAEKKVPLQDHTWEEFVDAVQGAVWRAIRGKDAQIGELAARTRLSRCTIVRFADRTTRRPQISTVYGLAKEVLDMRLTLVPNSAPVQPYELNLTGRKVGPKRQK